MFPIIRIVDDLGSANAHNGIFTIEIVKNVGKYQSWIGILAQERFEIGYKWEHLFWPRFSKDAQREMELMGHAVESVVASLYDKFNIDSYELVEAEALLYTYGSLFYGYTLVQIKDELQKRRAKALAWASDHKEFLDEWYAKRPK